MKEDFIDSTTLNRFKKELEEIQTGGFGEVILKVVIQNGKIVLVGVSSTQTLKVE